VLGVERFFLASQVRKAQWVALAVLLIEDRARAGMEPL